MISSFSKTGIYIYTVLFVLYFLSVVSEPLLKLMLLCLSFVFIVNMVVNAFVSVVLKTSFEPRYREKDGAERARETAALWINRYDKTNWLDWGVLVLVPLLVFTDGLVGWALSLIHVTMTFVVVVTCNRIKEYHGEED